MPLTRGQALAELDRRGALPPEYKAELAALKTGGDKEYLAGLDPERAALVQSIGEGRQTPPSASRSKDAQLLLQQVASAYPGFNAADAKSQQAMRIDLAKGKTADQLRSLNTAIGHIGSLSQSLDALGNVRVPLLTPAVNSIKNTLYSASGDPTLGRATMDRQAVSDELETAFRGGRGGTLEGTRGWKESLPLNGSPAQQSAAVQEAFKLLNSRVGAIGDQYSQAMGHASDGISLLSPEAQQTMADLSRKLGVPLAGQGGSVPPAIGGIPGGPRSPGGGNGGPTLGSGPSGTTLETTSRDEIAPAARQRAQALEDGLNSGRITTIKDALAVNPDANVDQLRKAFAYRAKGGTGHIPVVAQPAQAQDADAVGSGAAALANSLTFGALPKLGALGSAAIGSLTGKGNFSDIYGSELARNNATLDQAERQHPLASVAGDIGGFALGAGALTKLPGVAGALSRVPGAFRPAAADALYGAATGAGSSDNLSSLPGNIAGDAALTAGGGALGRGAARGVAAAVAPNVAPIVQRLANAGITMTPGQIIGAGGGRIGRWAKGVEDTLMGFRGIGEPIKEARAQGLSDYTTAEINNALAPIGKTVPKGLSGTDAIEWGQNASHDAYDPHLANMSLSFDLPFANDVAAVRSKVSSLPQSAQDEVKTIIKNHVEPFLPAQGADLTGRNLQNIKRGLASAASSYRGQGEPVSDITASALDDLQGAYLDLAARQAPADAAGYRAADAAYRNMQRVNAAAAMSKGSGTISPFQMLKAASKKGYGVTDADVATNSAPMQAFARDAQDVLPSTIPDSGTAGRYALGSMLGLIGGGSQGDNVHDSIAKGLLGSVAGAAAFSPAGARALQRVLIQRGPGAIRAGDAIRSYAPLAGSLTAPTLLDYYGGL